MSKWIGLVFFIVSFCITLLSINFTLTYKLNSRILNLLFKLLYYSLLCKRIKILNLEKWKNGNNKRS